MPYNTRRKSLSLPSLGIHLPSGSRVHRLSLKATPTSETTQTPPAKKLKRSHDGGEPLSPVSSPRSKTGSPAIDLPEPTPLSQRAAAEQTPPPSPRLHALPVRKVDTEGINDDIVIAVIAQLEKTGNRPHLIKDLATILASTNASIAHSANPAALLSSRLSLYLKRPWTALSPCPLAKELIPVHPRKVFFFLTTRPRLPLPTSSDDILPPSMIKAKILTPSVSEHSQNDDELELDLRQRARFSPSPEVELYSPDLDQEDPMQPPSPGEPFSNRSSLNPDGTPEVRRRPNRAPSPPLEADEKGFTETATAVRARGMSLHNLTVKPSVEVEEKNTEVIEETPEQRQKRDRELGMELFGQSHPGLHVPEQKLFSSSPMIQARHDHSSATARMDLALRLDDIDMGEAAWTMTSPEQIEVDELDVLFSGF
ncbi:hypothetical protein LTR99_007063 [Exophiala xenobiotica]|uniref:GDS1 winged helix domain-containing protein n=1 Tax=Vermiconidia calcicola TaxID=1690605 RepID=A0AAV9PTB7_9PEZI|nr:hypothetical protein H2202_001216 [Exophiala xenobiotica]KAK5528856.1 hypothetical protein LTR25_010040 [Vermiconidia calcicola]KAK5544976.1 hypothetical protein LTR23_004106 [Chaetothyriales sp. CCFEE 6169]KAK5208958.1 hypothetical protein LTR41_005356 [Exophiala xenobiotica]KAK5221114.1 hypothetical protein LTR72_006673 [Exophiala xenobiotica]